MAIDGEGVCSTDSPCPAASTFLRTPTLASASKCPGLVSWILMEMFHLTCDCRLPRVQWDPEGFGEWEQIERVAGSQRCCLWCSCLCHPFQVARSRYFNPIINPVLPSLLFTSLSQVQGYTQGEKWVQEKMKKNVQLVANNSWYLFRQRTKNRLKL